MIDNLDAQILRVLFNNSTTIYGLAKLINLPESLLRNRIKNLSDLKLIVGKKKSTKTLYTSNTDNVMLKPEMLMVINQKNIAIFPVQDSDIHKFVRKIFPELK